MIKYIQSENLKGYYTIVMDGVKIGTCMKSNRGGWRGNVYGSGTAAYGSTRKSCTESIIHKYNKAIKGAM